MKYKVDCLLYVAHQVFTVCVFTNSKNLNVTEM